MMICNCTLAGTQACKNCSRYKEYFGEQNRTDKVITVHHPNGFTGKLYGESSMMIYYQGEEFLHTGFTNVRTEEQLYTVLEGMTNFAERLEEKFLKGTREHEQ